MSAGLNDCEQSKPLDRETAGKQTAGKQTPGKTDTRQDRHHARQTQGKTDTGRAQAASDESHKTRVTPGTGEPQAVSCGGPGCLRAE